MNRLRIGFATRDWTFLDVDEHADGMANLPKPTNATFSEGVKRPYIGGAGYYRMLLPARALQDVGHLTYLGTLVENPKTGQLGVHTFDGLAHFDLDVLVLQRWMHVELTAAVRRAVADGQVIINDVDDWFDGLDKGNRAWWTSHPKLNLVENREHYARTIRAGSAVVCSTPFLVGKMRKENPNAHLIRNRIDSARFHATRGASEAQEARPTLGWVGALPWRSKGDVEALDGLIAPFVVEHGLKVIHGGAITGFNPDGTPLGTFAERVHLAPELVEERPVSPMSEYPGLLTGMGIGVAPLALIPFNNAKSAIKGMEYAAAGIPFVASPTDEYVRLAEHGVGRVARKPREWLHHWKALLDPELRAADAKINADLIDDVYAAAGYAQDWEDLLTVLI